MLAADRHILAPVEVRLDEFEALILHRPVRYDGPRLIFGRHNANGVAVVRHRFRIQPAYAANVLEWLEVGALGRFGDHIDWALAGAALVAWYRITAGQRCCNQITNQSHAQHSKSMELDVQLKLTENQQTPQNTRD